MANTLKVKYDYLSIMHYGKDFFAKLTPDKYGYLTTIEALNQGYTDKMGQRERVTKADAAKVNLLYGCSGKQHHTLQPSMTRVESSELYIWKARPSPKCEANDGGS